VPQLERASATDKFPVRMASLIGLFSVVLASTVGWASYEWDKLSIRVSQAEVQLVKAKKKLADRHQRTEKLRAVEVSLREEMLKLSSLVESQVKERKGLGISRAAVRAAFNDLTLINKDKSATRSSEHYALDDLVGSIQLHGPSDDLTQIDFFGALTGKQRDASAAMLAKLLSVAIPEWKTARRNAWLAKLLSVKDDMRVYKEFDRIRVEWHWQMLDGVRMDVLSIESR